jgi:hypothetical protein
VEWRYPIYTAGVDISKNCERPLLAVGRLWAFDFKRLLWRKPTLRLKNSEAIVDPKQPLDFRQKPV